MGHDALRNSSAAGAFADVLADLSDLVHKEFRLAKAEISEKISSRLQASAWMAAAGLVGFVALLLVVQAAVFAIASFGLALHWACLLVAGVVAAGAGAPRFFGRLVAGGGMDPTRTAPQ